MLTSPTPAADATKRWESKPDPWSTTERRQRSAGSTSRTDTQSAPECFAAFCTDSMQQKYRAASTAAGGRSAVVVSMVAGIELVAAADRRADTKPSAPSRGG